MQWCIYKHHKSIHLFELTITISRRHVTGWRLECRTEVGSLRLSHRAASGWPHGGNFFFPGKLGRWTQDTT